MTRTDYTDITLILDRSGSMSRIAIDMEGGIAKFIEEQKKLPGKCLFSVLQFDYTEAKVNTDWVVKTQEIASVARVPLVPRGGTPLNDAVAEAIIKTGERLAGLPESERPSNVLMLIVTDGEENSSQEYKGPSGKAAIREMVERQQKDYNWAFVFLGANVDAFAESASYGVAAASSTPYTPDSASVKAAFRGLHQNVAAYRSGGGVNALNWSDEQRRSITPDDPSNVSPPLPPSSPSATERKSKPKPTSKP